MNRIDELSAEFARITMEYVEANRQLNLILPRVDRPFNFSEDAAKEYDKQADKITRINKRRKEIITEISKLPKDLSKLVTHQ